jgi:hypothetical protein
LPLHLRVEPEPVEVARARLELLREVRELAGSGSTPYANENSSPTSAAVGAFAGKSA